MGAHSLSGTFELSGRTALVTGGARRLGAAAAMALARAGVNVIVHYSTAERDAQTLCQHLAATGVRAWTLRANLANPDETSSLFPAAFALAGPIDILINNASIFPEGTLDELNADDLNLNMQVNALAPHALARAMAAQGRAGAVINLLDTRINDYDRKHVAYHLSKRALAALTSMMAEEYAPKLRVNGIAPGLILPPEGRDESYLAALAHTNPLSAYGDESDITDAMLYLLRAGFVTGQILNVDGGRHLRGSFYA